ncbi:MAG: hypothetical protein NZZ60_03655 [Bacteroidia bacterium]|nr:hypothetical protein [Bacteroidia bacterium]MCX7652516.1 hypothetical protein [Bacteroidia bacterium]MDW8417634.1 hypothetical protein [Bacteroidia bacterium]
MRNFYWASYLIAFSLAQPVDIAKHKVDPLTFTFDDGRTTLADYVLSQLRQHATCCGVDNIYVELRITPEGNVENVRAMTGRNDCYKQSVRDILLPVRWKVENFRTTRPIYYELRFNEECKGTPEDNTYKPIPSPISAVAQQPTAPAQPPKEEAKPIALTPSLPGTSPTGDKQGPSKSPTEPQAAEPISKPKSTQKPEPKPTPEPKDQTAEAPKEPTKPKKTQPKPAPPAEEPATSAPATEPARKGYQPGKEPPKEAQPPNPPALVGKLPENLSKLSVSTPKGYKSTGEKRPPSEHIGSFVNTSGPRYSEPDYINGPIAKALYLKQEYRKRGVCGLVHVLLEVAIDAQGNVRGYRILRANRPDVEIATPNVLAGMKYKPTPLPMVFYTEFKIDVDCQSDQQKAKLDTVPDYLASPEGKLIRPAPQQRP